MTTKEQAEVRMYGTRRVDLHFWGDQCDGKHWSGGAKFAPVPCEKVMLASDHDAEVSRLTAELEAARKDAQRYRWLRPRIQIVRQGSVAKPNEKRAAIETRIGCSFMDSPLPYSTNPEHQEQLSLELDAAIDAAMEPATGSVKEGA